MRTNHRRPRLSSNAASGMSTFEEAIHLTVLGTGCGSNAYHPCREKVHRNPLSVEKRSISATVSVQHPGSRHTTP